MKQPKAIPDHYPVIALAGNPNVGKSTLFNSLTTGKKQHTGNWIGKTTANAWGICHSPARDYTLVDIPGTYSLSSRSAEEEVAGFLSVSVLIRQWSLSVMPPVWNAI